MPVHRRLDRRDAVAERHARRKIERNRVGDEQTLVVDRKRRAALAETRDRRQRHHRLRPVLTAEPVEAAALPVLAIELVAWLRAAFAAARRWRCRLSPAATTVPATALVACEPPTAPPEVLT